MAEGAAKPEATVVLTQSVAPVRKLAVFLPISDEAVLDGAAFFQDILNDLTADLVRAENAQILSGSGVAPNLEGLTVVASTQTQARAQTRTWTPCSRRRPSCARARSSSPRT